MHKSNIKVRYVLGRSSLFDVNDNLSLNCQGNVSDFAINIGISGHITSRYSHLERFSAVESCPISGEDWFHSLLRFYFFRKIPTLRGDVYFQNTRRKTIRRIVKTLALPRRMQFLHKVCILTYNTPNFSVKTNAKTQPVQNNALPGSKASCRVMSCWSWESFDLQFNSFLNCSRSSEWINSMALWWIMSDYKEDIDWKHMTKE